MHQRIVMASYEITDDPVSTNMILVMGLKVI